LCLGAIWFPTVSAAKFVLRRERRVGTKLEHHSIGLGRALNVRQLSTTDDGRGR
jgi:hypothetical protein